MEFKPAYFQGMIAGLVLGSAVFFGIIWIASIW